MSFKSSVLLSVLSIATLAMPTAAVVAQGEGGIPGIKPAAVATEMSEEEMIKKASTLLIYNRLAQMLIQLKQDGIELDQEAGLEGARLAIAGKPPSAMGVSMADAQSIMMKLQKRSQAAQEKRQAEMMEKMKALAAKNKTEGDAYLAENGKKEGVKTLENGVQYEVMVAGTGPKPQSTDKVRINYHGTSIDGKVFDSTIEPPSGRPPEPYVSSASGFVKGFNVAIQSMPVGSKWKISIPAEAAYGLRGGGPIGPNQTIIFEVELLEILAEDAAPASAGSGL